MTKVAATAACIAAMTTALALPQESVGAPPSAPRTRATHALVAVSARSASDVWALGSVGYSRPYVLHWNGILWEEVPLDIADDAVLSDMKVISPNSVWAVGATADHDVLIEHWDGDVFTAFPSVNPDPGDNRLTSVTGTSRDVWAAGEQSSGCLLEHWNGVEWSLSDSPSGDCYDIASPGADDAWTVQGTRKLLHWDGSQWTAVKKYRWPETYLSTVTSASTGSAWVTGRDNSPNGSFGSHWTGSRWSSFIGGCDDYASVSDLTAISDTDAWALSDCNETGDTAISHWSGGHWRTEYIGLRNGYLNAIDGTSPSDVWAVGAQGRNEVIMHWDGTAWQISQPRARS